MTFWRTYKYHHTRLQTLKEEKGSLQKSQQLSYMEIRAILGLHGFFHVIWLTFSASLLRLRKVRSDI